MTRGEIVILVIGLLVPVVAAPFIAMGLRHLFAVFVTEGAELFGDISLHREDARITGALLAKLNVTILLVAWVGLFACNCFDQSITVVTAIGLSGLALSLLITLMIVHYDLCLPLHRTMLIGLLAFVGGNLPIIVLVAVVLAILHLV